MSAQADAWRYTRGERLLIALYGLSALLSVALAWVLPTLWALSLALILCVALASLLDRALLRWRSKVGRTLPLTSEGLTALNAHLNTQITLCEEGFTPELVEYDEQKADSSANSSANTSAPLDEEALYELLELYSELQAELQATQRVEPTLRLSLKEHLEAVTLPRLPLLEGREQLGLRVKATLPQGGLPKGSVFVWESDLGVARSEAADELPLLVKVNRRTLTSRAGLDLFQGGGPEQRSNACVLGNFYWCQSEATPREAGRYLLYPPNYLGLPNCEYITTLSASGLPCSGLRALRQLEPGEALLMSTGSLRSALVIQLRLVIMSAALLLAPAAALLMWSSLLGLLQLELPL